MTETVTFEDKGTDDGSPDERRVARLLSMVGTRVRDARKRSGLSRRELSEKSNVSPRYIAQLETGQGNVSIALLMRLADALDLRIEWLVAQNNRYDTEIGTISNMLPSATKEQLGHILSVLDPEHSNRSRAQRIAFIGLRGAGKSTLGRLTAEKLSLPFLELNDEIEQASGMAVNEVIALYGHEGYRHLERNALERITATRDALVLAVAGGIVANPDSFNYLLRTCHTIWLRAEPEDHMSRVRDQGDERPMAGNPHAMEELRNILTSRETMYALASASVDTSGQSLKECLSAILGTINNSGFLSD